MKISSEQKSQSRRRLLEAAVDVIMAKGFKSASMREIARRAEVGDATIYNYFPSKEKLMFGVCELKQEQVAQALLAIQGFNELSFREQLHQLVEAELEQWLPEREFLRQIFDRSFFSPVASIAALDPTRQMFTRMADDLIDAAIEVGEMPEPPYRELVGRLLWDYQTAILAYWLNDDSERFANTTQVVDRSVELIALTLTTGLVTKSLDLVSFLFRTHVVSRLDLLRRVSRSGGTAKRPFLQGETDGENGPEK